VAPVKQFFNPLINTFDKFGKKIEAMPPKQKMALAAGSAAGAAVLAGSIGGIVEASKKASSEAAKPAPKARVGTAENPKVVTVQVPVEVEVTPAPATGYALFSKGREAGAAKPIAEQIGTSAPQGVLIAVAAFVFFGCCFLGISGIAYFHYSKKRATRSTFAQLSRVAPEDAEALQPMTNSNTVEDLPLLA